MVDLTALTLSIALGYNQYTDEKGSEPEYTYKFQVGHEDTPLYLFGGYEDPTVRMLGQGIGVAEIFSLGIGAKKELGDGFFVFGEVGYGKVETEPRIVIQQEVVYTELVRNHNVFNRPVPVDLGGPYDKNSYESSWELDDGILGAIGVGYQVNEHLSVTGAYRPFYVAEYIHIANPGAKEAGLGYWEESRSRDLSSFQLHIAWTF